VVDVASVLKKNKNAVVSARLAMNVKNNLAKRSAANVKILMKNA